MFHRNDLNLWGIVGFQVVNSNISFAFAFGWVWVCVLVPYWKLQKVGIAFYMGSIFSSFEVSRGYTRTRKSSPNSAFRGGPSRKPVNRALPAMIARRGGCKSPSRRPCACVPGLVLPLGSLIYLLIFIIRFPFL